MRNSKRHLNLLNTRVSRWVEVIEDGEMTVA